jgi:Domain of unknown function (DUF4792)
LFTKKTKIKQFKYFVTKTMYIVMLITERRSMHGVKRVIAFCCLTTVVPTILIILPLYLKHQVFKDIVYSVAESDILEVRDGISTIFCQQHTLKMNSTFSAFQLNHMPNQSKIPKHIRLKKSMNLPDDTLEYWGFYLMKGERSSVDIKMHAYNIQFIVL